MADYFDQIIKGMLDKWPSNIVSRIEAPQFSGGSVSVKLLANQDCQGTGPVGRFYVGRKACYTGESLAKWIRARMSK